MSAAPVLVFHHIPKTAGTAVRTALYNMFGEANCEQIREVNFLSLEPVRRATAHGEQPRLVSGHIPVRYVGEDWDVHTVTFLRDPVERVMSLYRFMRGQAPETYAHTGLRANFTLREFLDCGHPEVTSQIDNGMCRFLAREHSAWPIDAPDNPDFRPDLKTLFSAAEALNVMAVGICERMDESLALLSRRWGLPFELGTQAENVSPALAEEAVADEVAEISQRNALDAAIYKIGMQRFEEQLRVPRRKTPALVPAPVFAPGREYRIDVLPARDGFHAFEHRGGISWISAGTSARIRFRCGEEQVSGFSIRIYTGTHGYPVEAAAFLVNGAKPPFAWHADANDPAWGTMFLGPFTPQSGLNVLEIQAPAYAQAARTEDSLDPRTLAFGVAALRAR
ncbi:sulfotransferase family 2 domain-containing protein [Terricaulis sp.]|uniref:sulfotransferase family 2 domain-containing protein n=1 Tax=Terricaulis sp. TaxID=2768686 RepID=UPI0037834138